MSDLKQRLLSYAPASGSGAALPAALAALLAGSAVLQLALPAPATIPEGATAGRPPQWPLPPVGVPETPPPALLPSLYTPARLGAALGEVMRTGEDGEAPAAPKPRPVGPVGGAWVLGSMRVGAARAVLLRLPGGGAVRLAPGRAWRGWRLIAIGDTSASFRHGNATRRIAFGAAPAADETSESEDSSE